MHDSGLDMDFEHEEVLEEAPEHLMRVQVVNFERLAELLDVARMLRELLADDFWEGKINIEVDPVHGYGTVQVEADEITIYAPKAFAETVKHASNFEIYPLTNGQIRLAFMFHNLSIEVTEQ